MISVGPRWQCACLLQYLLFCSAFSYTLSPNIFSAEGSLKPENPFSLLRVLVSIISALWGPLKSCTLTVAGSTLYSILYKSRDYFPTNFLHPSSNEGQRRTLKVASFKSNMAHDVAGKELTRGKIPPRTICDKIR